MANPKPGAAVVMAVPRGNLTASVVDAVFRCILQRDHMVKSQLELWDDPNWVKQRVEGVLGKTKMPCLDIYWTPPRDGPLNVGMMLSYYIDPMNRESLKVDGCDILTVWIYDVQLLDENAGKFEVPLDRFKKIVDIVKPAFAVVDHYQTKVRKRKEHDLRRFGWGATVYGPSLVKQIGRDKLLSTPAYRVEELPWGGLWVQAAKNPFEAMPVAVKAVEKHLGLKQLFGDAEAPTRKAKAS